MKIDGDILDRLLTALGGVLDDWNLNEGTIDINEKRGNVTVKVPSAGTFSHEFATPSPDPDLIARRFSSWLVRAKPDAPSANGTGFDMPLTDDEMRATVDTAMPSASPAERLALELKRVRAERDEIADVAERRHEELNSVKALLAQEADRRRTLQQRLDFHAWLLGCITQRAVLR
jgi:hypothetical protein